jgi:hypothetical protein
MEQHPEFTIEAWIKKQKRRPYKDYAWLARQVSILSLNGLQILG